MLTMMACVLAAAGFSGPALEEDSGAAALPRSVAEDLYRGPDLVSIPVGEAEEESTLDPLGFVPLREAAESGGLSLGAAGGYLKAHSADHGTWFAGVQARLHFLEFFAAEASITFHENEYEHGAVHVTQYPVQVSGMFYPIPGGQFQPYIVAGAGWYYTRFTYSGTLSGISNETDHTFGGHAGAGLELMLGSRTSIDADIRYIFVNPSSAAVKSGDFDYWQVTFGLNFFF